MREVTMFSEELRSAELDPPPVCRGASPRAPGAGTCSGGGAGGGEGRWKALVRAFAGSERVPARPVAGTPPDEGGEGRDVVDGGRLGLEVPRWP